MVQIKRFRFSKKRIAELPIPPAGRVEYRDESTPGLVLRVTANGKKSFCVVRKVNGQLFRITIGSTPPVTVEQAQKVARDLQGKMAAGADPRAARREVREESTFKNLFDFWMESHAKPRKRTWHGDEKQYNTHLKKWAGRKLSSIKREDVQRLHLHIAENGGRYAANRVLALVRAMFNKAEGIGYKGDNPATGIKKFPEEKRDRFLHGEELRAFFSALAEEQNETVRDYFLVCLLTGARKSNVLSMQWADVDMQTRLWRIPETKSGKPVVVPLVGMILAVLRTRREAANGSPWVFPSHGATGHLVEPKKAWKRVIDRAGLVGIRPHDLRRSLGSWMTMTGAGLPVVGKMLGHTQPVTTAIYARLAVDPVREAAEKAVDAMREAAGLLIDVESAEGGNDE